MNRLCSVVLFFAGSVFLAQTWNGYSPTVARADFSGDAPAIVGLATLYDPGSGNEGYTGHILTADGRVWRYGYEDAEAPFVEDYTSAGNPWGTFPLPVAVADIRFWNYRTLVTLDDDVWILAPEISPYGRGWVNIGQPPESPVGSEVISTGEAKGRFER